MFAAIASAWALLLGIALIMLGNGLQGTLLGVRATLEGFGTGTTGFVMTGYFAGFLAGSVIVPRLLANVGHIRVFAALASLASGATLLHTVIVTPISWFCSVSSPGSASRGSSWWRRAGSTMRRPTAPAASCCRCT